MLTRTVFPGCMAILCWNFEYPDRLVNFYPRSALGFPSAGLVSETSAVCHRLSATDLVGNPRTD